MNKNITKLIWPVVVLVIAFGAFYLKPWQTKIAETITVSAEGKADSVPNVGKITATIESKNTNLDLARAENEKKISDIVTKLKTLGVDEKDIKTNYISGNSQGQEPMMYMRPRNYSPSPQSTMTTTLEITIRNFKTADAVIAALTSNSATNIYGPQLTVEDAKLETAKSQARTNAVENAKKKAIELASASGRKIGKAIKITEQGDFEYPMPMLAKSSADLSEKASSIQPGQNEVTINLSVDWELK